MIFGFFKYIKFVPVVFELVKLAEDLVTGIKQGAVKKKVVMTILEKLLGIARVPGDEIKDILGALDTLVDAAVGILHDLGIFKSAGGSAANGGK